MNGSKPSKPKDLGWIIKRIKRQKEFLKGKRIAKIKRKGEKSKRCPECRYPRHPGHVLVNYVEERGIEFKDCPKLKPPKEVPEQTIEFCIECMVPHPQEDAYVNYARQ